MEKLIVLFSIVVCLFSTTNIVTADTDQIARNEINQINNRVNRLEQSVRNASTGGVALFLFGAFCALWAQNSGRNAWLWFFFGLFFSVVTVLFLLSFNSKDRRDNRSDFDLQKFRTQ